MWIAIVATFVAALLGLTIILWCDLTGKSEEPDKKVSHSIWGPLGHFTIFQQDTDDVWSIEGVLTNKPDAKIYSGTHPSSDQAIEHAKVLAGIMPPVPDIRPEEIRPTPTTDRRGLIAHSRALS